MSKPIDSKIARRISLRQIQVFEAVARNLSFTKAAEELHLTQPTVSMQLKKLEQDIGAVLTEQLGRKISLTGAGHEFAELSRDILSRLAHFEVQLNDKKGLHSGELRLAVVSTANYFAPKLLGQFCKVYPNINVLLEVTNRDRILERMANNQDDLYLVGKPPRSDKLDFKPYLPNPLVVIAPKDHPLSLKKGISVKELANEPLIIREKGSGTRIAVEQVFAKEGLTPNIRMELGNNESIKQGVLGGLGISVLSMHTLTSGDFHEISLLDVEGFPLSWRWYMGYPKGKHLSIVAQTFIEFMYKERIKLLPEEIREYIDEIGDEISDDLPLN